MKASDEQNDSSFKEKLNKNPMTHQHVSWLPALLSRAHFYSDTSVPPEGRPVLHGIRPWLERAETKDGLSFAAEAKNIIKEWHLKVLQLHIAVPYITTGGRLQKGVIYYS